MKIFTNFDTKFSQRIIQEKQKQYPKKDILLLYRSKYYLFFRVLCHLAWYIVILLLLLLFIWSLQWYWFLMLPLIIVWTIVVWFRVVHKFLKYKYDFTIVTPQGITTYKQKGVLHSVIKEIPSRRIKAIEVCRTDILWNIFWYGHVDIIADLTENSRIWTNNEAPWVIWLTYVDKAYEVKEHISWICFR